MKIIDSIIKIKISSMYRVFHKTLTILIINSDKLKNNITERVKAWPWSKIEQTFKWLAYIGGFITFIMNLYINAFNTVSQRYEEQYSRLQFHIGNLINQIPNLSLQKVVK